MVPGKVENCRGGGGGGGYFNKRRAWWKYLRILIYLFTLEEKTKCHYLVRRFSRLPGLLFYRTKKPHEYIDNCKEKNILLSGNDTQPRPQGLLVRGRQDPGIGWSRDTQKFWVNCMHATKCILWILLQHCMQQTASCEYCCNIACNKLHLVNIAATLHATNCILWILLQHCMQHFPISIQSGCTKCITADQISYSMASLGQKKKRQLYLLLLRYQLHEKYQVCFSISFQIYIPRGGKSFLEEELNLLADYEGKDSLMHDSPASWV